VCVQAVFFFNPLFALGINSVHHVGLFEVATHNRVVYVLIHEDVFETVDCSFAAPRDGVVSGRSAIAFKKSSVLKGVVDIIPVTNERE